MPKIIPTEAECILWFKNKGVNPKTNRRIKIDGPVYNDYYKHYHFVYKLADKNENEYIQDIKNFKEDKKKKHKRKSESSEIDTSQLEKFPILMDRRYIKKHNNPSKKFKWTPTSGSSFRKITFKNKEENIKGRENQMYCYMDTYESIHKDKFIMLKNGNCYDVEVLMNHIVSSYENKTPFSDPGNIDPESTDKIWNNITDLKRLIAHRLIQKPKIISDDDWLYSKDKFIKNCKAFRSKVIKNQIWDMKYLELFENNIQLLFEINRLAFVFHTDQPTNYFDPEKIKFEDLGDLDNTKIDILYKELMDILNEKYKRDLNHIQHPDKLRHEIVDIFTAEGSELYDALTKDLNHTYDQKIKILVNLSYMYGLSQNFKESIKAKEDFLKYITSFPKKERKLIYRLLKHVLRSNECIHLLGNRLKKVFIKYWFLFLENKGLSKKTIATNFLPKVYGKELNEKSIVKSKLLLNSSEDTHGYYYTVLNKVPYWVNKMGRSGTWDGVSLKDFDTITRRSHKY